MKKDLPDPFKNIGLAFSGGGFRAAAFSLGTLSYLEHLELSGNISMISSASGGTITNLLYSSAIHRGESFADFFNSTKEKLSGDGLLEKVLTVLNDDTEWNVAGSSKQRNLINAFAKVYDRYLFNQETFEVFANKTHIKKFQVCCNSTEFYRGLSFRFQTNGTLLRDQVIGNRYLYFDKLQLAAFRHIKLADVLAASSCFPVGFEPILFPEDFAYGELDVATLRAAVCYENYQEDQHHLSDPVDLPSDPKQLVAVQSFGLMDGGITDNQGLYSLMTADKKRRRKARPEPFDLMIVTDVSGYFMDEFVEPALETAGNWRKENIDHYLGEFKQWIRYPKTIQWLCLIIGVALVAAGMIWSCPWLRFPGLILGGGALAISILALVLRNLSFTQAILSQPETFDPVKAIRRNLPLRSFSDKVINKLLFYFGHTPLTVLERMLRARLSSVSSMVEDINLKQIRRLIFEMFFTQDCWDYRRVPNFIYELSSFNARARHNRLHDPKRLKWTATAADLALLDEGLELLQLIAERARLMSTTLWFDDTDKGRLDDIIITGQFTTCMNLLEYVISLERQGVRFDAAKKEFLSGLRAKLITDINTFKINPDYLTVR